MAQSKNGKRAKSARAAPAAAVRKPAAAPKIKKTATSARAGRLPPATATYQHGEQTPARPDVGTQAQFRRRATPRSYRYDSSLAPALEFDSLNPAREQGEALVAQVLAAQTLEEAKAAAEKLRRLSQPFLNWAGKAERLSFEVPTLPLFVHERLSTRAILATLQGHRLDKQIGLFDLFGDPGRPIHQQLNAYEYLDDWSNRMILGDSLVVMNSLLAYEQMAGKVQMIYMDPPYGVKFGSNFQPFVRKRDVKPSDDEDMTREPEMVQAYRDTWELGLHSYLTYLRDRLYLAKDLLHPSGSIFVQISDENLHHVREVMEEVFGAANFVVTFLVKKKGSQKGGMVDPVNDYLLWFAKNRERAAGVYCQLYEKVELTADVAATFRYVELADGREVSLRDLTKEDGNAIDYAERPDLIARDFLGARLFTSENITSGGFRRTQSVPFEFRGSTFDPGIAQGNCWKHSAVTDDGSPSGMQRLAEANRLFVGDKQLRFKRYLSDFGYTALSNWWDGLGGASNPTYVVQTNAEIVKRCMLMTTRPGDLVLDPTCGSGTTAYVAEQWGRRWITCDTSRVPLALARQRLLTATFDWYELADPKRGPAGGFVYKRRQNSKGEEVGGIVPHISSSTVANNEPPKEEVLVDRPEINSSITRVTGRFCVEATIPAALDPDQLDAQLQGEPGRVESETDRMLEVLRASPLLRLPGNRSVKLRNIRRPAKTLSLSAEALVDSPGSAAGLDAATAQADADNGGLALTGKPVALVFGPETAAVAEKTVFDAAREAVLKGYSHLYVIGFAIQPAARAFIEQCEALAGIPATYVQASPDLMMGDLLKHMRSSQIFAVCGLPEVKLRRVPRPAEAPAEDRRAWFVVELLGLDVFNPATNEVESRKGSDVPAWFLDHDYSELSFHANQAFFPRTAAWDNLKRSLRGEFADEVWAHLAGAVSVPFPAGERGQIAVKAIDDRGNELMVVKKLTEAEEG